MKKFFLLALAAVAFAACSDDNYYYQLSGTSTIDFEGAVLSDDGFIWGKSKAIEQDDVNYSGDPIKSNIYYGSLYAEKDAAILTYYTDYGHTYDTWNGFVVSNRTDMETSGYTNDKSVYATSGADGSSQFAVAYYSEWTPDGKGIPEIKFLGAVQPKSVAIANTSFLYLYFKEDAAAVVDVKAVITGYNCGIKTGVVEVALADGVLGKVENGWKNIDLSELGTVTSLTFSMKTTDAMCPNYFAVDNLVYIK